MRDRDLLLAVPTLVVVASACTLIEVPFMPSDASGGAGNASGGAADGSGAQGSFSSGGFWGYGGEHDLSEDVVTAQSTVVGLHVTDSHVYWLTHGTFIVPTLPNMDGALARTGVDGGAIEALITGLDRPVRLGMTTSAVYVWLQETSTSPEGSFREARLGENSSVSLDVGASPPVHFFAFEDRAYISHDLGENSGVFEHVLDEAPRQVIWGMPTDLAANSTHVFYTMENGHLLRAPLDDPMATEELATDVVQGFELWRDQVLVLRGTTLSSMPQEGGAFAEKVSLPADGTYADLRVAGDRFFVAAISEFYHMVHSGLVSQGDVEDVWDVYAETSIWFGAEKGFYVANYSSVRMADLD